MNFKNPLLKAALGFTPGNGNLNFANKPCIILLDGDDEALMDIADRYFDAQITDGYAYDREQGQLIPVPQFQDCAIVHPLTVPNEAVAQALATVQPAKQLQALQLNQEEDSELWMAENPKMLFAVVGGTEALPVVYVKLPDLGGS